jgi:AIG2-like family
MLASVWRGAMKLVHGPQERDPGELAGVTSADDESLRWYFAFGSNMAERVLLGRRRLAVAKEFIRPGFVRGFHLRYDIRGIPLFEPSFASAQRCDCNGDHDRFVDPGRAWGDLWDEFGKGQGNSSSPDTPGCPHIVWGVCYALSAEQLAALYHSEGGDGTSPYEPLSVEVFCAAPAAASQDAAPSSSLIIASTLVRRQDASFQSRFLTDDELPYNPPSRRYMDLLREGAKEHHLPPYYVRELEEAPQSEVVWNFATVLRVVMLLPFLLCAFLLGLLTLCLPRTMGIGIRGWFIKAVQRSLWLFRTAEVRLGLATPPSPRTRRKID